MGTDGRSRRWLAFGLATLVALSGVACADDGGDAGGAGDGEQQQQQQQDDGGGDDGGGTGY